MNALSASRLARLVAWCLCVAIVALSCGPGPAGAAPLPPETPQRLDDLAKIQRVLEQTLVRQRLAELGVADEEALRRLARLDDHELHELAQRLEELDAGGEVRCSGSDGQAFVCLGIVAALFVIWLIIYVVCRFTGGESCGRWKALE